MRPIRAVLLFAAVLACSSARAGDLRNFDDAALRAVQFIEPAQGWAVGDDGVVWHTIDGGKNWERQSTGVRSSLRSVYFVNPFEGWIAGREELPGGGTTGVLLHTKDGGVAWQRLLPNCLPGLNVVRFLPDGKTGFLAGDGSDAQPSGVFATKDGGRSWAPVAGARVPSWLAADFDVDNGGALAGAWDRLATLRHDRVSLAKIEGLGGRNIQGVRLRGKTAVAVGQGGLVLISDGAAGSQWGFVELGLSRETLSGWDFNAVGGSGKEWWVVGRPGTVVLHSRDDGATWEVQKTGQPLPLNGVFFHDAQRGWAVGELGSILATVDGGKSWQVQRRGGQRAALLAVHARAAGTALEAVAQLGGDEGYLIAGLRVTASDPSTAAPIRATEGARFSAGLRQAGGAAGELLWQFPVPSQLARGGRQPLVQSWDGLHGESRGAEQLLRQLVLALRIWRPAVVVTDAPDENASVYAADGLIAEAVREAFQRAGDPTAFPEQLTDLGLQPWKATKAYARCEAAQTPVTLDLTEVSDVLGSSVREFAAEPAALLAESATILPARVGFRLLASRLPGANAHTRLMEGVDLPAGGLARRALTKVEPLGAAEAKALRQRSLLLALADAKPDEVGDSGKLLSRIGPMLADVPEHQAAPAVYAVAGGYARQGQWELAREAYLFLVDHYPTHQLAAESYRWLIKYNCSSEAHRRHELGQFYAVRQTELSASFKDGEGKPDPNDKMKHPAMPDVVERRSLTVQQMASRADWQRWYEGALSLEPKLASFGPAFSDDPAMQFCLQSARRNLGDFETPKKYYTQFVARQPAGPWRDAAAAELWLMKRSGPAPKPVAYCRYTESRPHLDGKLDEPCWQSAKIVDLRPRPEVEHKAGEKPDARDPRTDYPTEVRMTHDDEYLYLAVRCFHPQSTPVEPAKGRKHDSDLRGHDRVSIMLDLDRDYATCFHLQVDERGLVRDECWGDASWNPKWFVAVQSEPTVWVVEAALPLKALTGDVITAGRAWACNVLRATPGVELQAFSWPAEAPEEALRPEGMGLLMFTRDPRQTASAQPNPR